MSDMRRNKVDIKTSKDINSTVSKNVFEDKIETTAIIGGVGEFTESF